MQPGGQCSAETDCCTGIDADDNPVLRYCEKASATAATGVCKELCVDTGKAGCDSMESPDVPSKSCCGAPSGVKCVKANLPSGVGTCKLP